MIYAVPGQTGECLSCAKLSVCSTTSLEKAMGDFTCVLYVPVAEPIYDARVDMIKRYGCQQALRAMLRKPETEEEG